MRKQVLAALALLDGTSGSVLQTAGGNSLVGTFLDTRGGDFQFSSLNLTGQLINTAGHIQFVSNSRMVADAFAPPGSPPPVIPEPSVWAMMLIGFFGLGEAVRKRRRTMIAA